MYTEMGSLWAAWVHDMEKTCWDEPAVGEEQCGTAMGTLGSVWDSLPRGTACFHTEVP